MAASKWRLTKAEEKQVKDEGNALKAQKLAEGSSEEEAQKARKEFEKLKEQELKQAKADRNEARKAKAKAGPSASANALALSSAKAASVMPDKTQVNQAYYAKLQDALQTIQAHKCFKRINEADALKITGDETSSGVQAWAVLKPCHNFQKMGHVTNLTAALQSPATGCRALLGPDSRPSLTQKKPSKLFRPARPTGRHAIYSGSICKAVRRPEFP